MHVLTGNDPPSPQMRDCVLAIGNFDGVHKGHQALFAEAQRRAKTLGTRAGAVIFEPHPREFFAPDAPHFRLTPLPEKLRLLELYGLDVAIVLTFSQALAELSAQQFIQKQLHERLGVRHVVVGYDFLFGKGRTGNADTLVDEGRRLGFSVSVIAAQGTSENTVNDHRETGSTYSSSAVREHLRHGQVAEANAILGHRWRVSGTVADGAKIGTDIGFPTANIALPEGTDLAHGVYAVLIYLGDQRLSGTAYYGSRPTVDGGTALLEVTIFDFSGDIYGREIGVEFVEFVRGDKTFPSLDALSTQIVQDCERVRTILREATI